MRFRTRTLAVPMLLTLAGCGGMSANECELADWQAVGYTDGARGRTADAFESHSRSCAKHAVAADFQAYRSGREAGLQEYCQPANGYRVGSRGYEYYGVCPPQLEGRFYDAYLEGLTLHDLQYAVNKTRGQLSASRARIDAIELELADKVAAQFTGELTPDQRARLLIETQQLNDERNQLTVEVARLEKQLQRQRGELEAHTQEIVARR